MAKVAENGYRQQFWARLNRKLPNGVMQKDFTLTCEERDSFYICKLRYKGNEIESCRSEPKPSKRLAGEEAAMRGLDWLNNNPSSPILE